MKQQNETIEGQQAVNHMQQDVIRYLESQQDAMREWVLNFVRVPTTNPPGQHYGDFVQQCRELFAQLALPYEIHEVPEELVREKAPYADGERRLIVMSTVGSQEAGPLELHFNGHYDVVPAGADWSKSHPFEPKVEDGLVYGRGTADMKSALVAMAFALASLKKWSASLPGRVSLSFVPDEEMGGETGTGYLVKAGLVRPSFCLIGEPTGLSTVWVAHKGRIEGQLTVSGAQAHGSIPWKGQNAFVRAARLIAWLDEQYGNLLTTRRTSFDTDPQMDPSVGNPSVLWGGTAQGGSKATIVPGATTVSFDRRVLPEEDAQEAFDELIEMVKRGATEVGIPAEDIAISGRIVRYPVVGGIQEGELAIFREVACSLGDAEPRFVLGPGGTDLTHFVENGFRGVVVGPGEWEQAHTQDEHIRLEEVWRASRYYALFAISYLHGNGVGAKEEAGVKGGEC